MSNNETIVREDVPAYLRSGALFQNLDSVDEEKFDVPADCLKKDPNVANFSDLLFVLRSARFWGLDVPPLTIISFMVKDCDVLGDNFAMVLTEFPEFAKFLSSVLQVGQQTNEQAISTAIKQRLGVEVVKQLHEQDSFPLASEAYSAAAEVDDLPTVKYLQHKDCVWSKDSVTIMVANASFQCLQYVLAMPQFNRTGIVTCAVSHKQVGVVQYLLSMGILPESNTIDFALGSGNVELVRMLKQAGCDWSENSALTCVMLNHLDCLIYAHENGCPWIPILCAAAAARGHLQCLEYLHMHGAYWDTGTLITAARYNQLACLEYAHQRGCPLTEDVTKHAVVTRSFRCALYCAQYCMLGDNFGFLVLSFIPLCLFRNLAVLCLFLLNALACFVELHDIVYSRFLIKSTLLVIRIVMFALITYLLSNNNSDGLVE